MSPCTLVLVKRIGELSRNVIGEFTYSSSNSTELPFLVTDNHNYYKHKSNVLNLGVIIELESKRGFNGKMIVIGYIYYISL